MQNKNGVFVYSLSKKFKKFEKNIKKIAIDTLKILNKNDCSLEIFLVSNILIKELNRIYRGKNISTNVLSFNYDQIVRPDLGFKKFLGEIYLAPDFIQKEKQEMGFLVVHSILHLLGYTHFTLKNSIIMKRKEEKIWSLLKNKK